MGESVDDWLEEEVSLGDLLQLLCKNYVKVGEFFVVDLNERAVFEFLNLLQNLVDHSDGGIVLFDLCVELVLIPLDSTFKLSLFLLRKEGSHLPCSK